MRKRLKKKLRSCALCKPHKMGWDNRWKPKEEALLNETEKELAAETRCMLRAPKGAGKKERGLALLAKASSGLTGLTYCAICH